MFQLPVLVHEAICIQVWRLKIYPQIMKLEPAPANTFGIYMVVSIQFYLFKFNLEYRTYVNYTNGHRIM